MRTKRPAHFGLTGIINQGKGHWGSASYYSQAWSPEHATATETVVPKGSTSAADETVVADGTEFP